jgi:hypothetical protein
MALPSSSSSRIYRLPLSALMIESFVVATAFVCECLLIGWDLNNHR